MRRHGRIVADAATPPRDAWVRAMLSRMSLREKVGQLFTTYVHGTDANTPSRANVDEFGVATPAEVVSRYHLGGVVYFDNADVDNIADPKQVATLSDGLQRAALASGAHIPLTISTDQEEGTVTRIGAPATVFPGSMALGAGRSTADARRAAEITGAELRAMGMTAHISFPRIDPSGEPATLSPTILSGMLRGELGYGGVVITDSLQMQGVRTLHPDTRLPTLALRAGADVMLMPAHLGLAIESVCRAVEDGTLTEDRIDTSVARLLRLKFANGAAHDPFVDPDTVFDTVGTPAHRAAAQRIADCTVTAVRNENGLLPQAGDPRRVLVTGWGEHCTSALAADIGTRVPTAEARPTGAAPGEAAIAGAVAAAKRADLVVDLTHDLANGPRQRALLTALREAGTPVVAVAVGTPYDVGYLPSAPTWLATYGHTDVSMRSVTKVLFGDLAPRGRLPVEVPSGADPSRTLYPLGYGLAR